MLIAFTACDMTSVRDDYDRENIFFASAVKPNCHKPYKVNLLNQNDAF